MDGKPEPISIRAAHPDDGPPIRRLAVLDSAPPLAGPVLVAEVGGELRAALSLGDRRVVADPFRHTAELVVLLRVHAAQLRRPGRGTSPLRAAAEVLRALAPKPEPRAAPAPRPSLAPPPSDSLLAYALLRAQ